jgi:tetratricopeptide (TPR) repeat protein
VREQTFAIQNLGWEEAEMETPESLKATALAHRNAQRMEDAYAAILRAADLAPNDPTIAAIHAQLALETGRLAVPLFEKARLLEPDNLMLTRSYCAALAGEGQFVEAIALLDASLKERPNWLDGHKLITSLRHTSGEVGDFARSYAAACAVQPQNLSLRLAWFHTYALARDWERAQAIIDEGERLIGARQAFTVARLFILSESGHAAQDAHLFDAVADIRDPGLDLAQVRHLLKLGNPAKAEVIASRNLNTASAHAFWPYLSLIWRLSDNPNANWLDAPDQLIKSYDLAFTSAELEDLAETLRQLHTRKAAFLGQSVRGGTQTDGHLFLRREPAIQEVRARITTAIRDYIADLPAVDPAHPLLGVRRDQIQFEGSWSVRLAAQGFHACHTHTMGWISSALYVSLPEPAKLGAAPAGWIAFGTPPPELGLTLPAYKQIEPKVGRLVLFPSTMWHGTLPFEGGERLTLAFDVRRFA